MTVPAVTLTEVDGSLGVLPNGEKLRAMCGVCDSGTANLPASFASVNAVVAAFGGGPLVEEACHYIEINRKPVLLCKTGNSIEATEDTLVISGVTGTSVVTWGDDTTANDDYDLYFQVVAGGTIGTAGITYVWSLDGGRTLSPITALGTAETWVAPSSGGIGLAFAAGTLVAGDVVTGRTYAPNWNATELGAAINALGVSAQAWDLLDIVGPIDATAFAAIGTAFAGLPKRMWIGACRMPLSTETEATYLAAMVAIFGGLSTTVGGLCYGAAQTVSGVTFRTYRRPTRTAVFARLGEVDESVDIAQVDLGTLPGVQIRDRNGNLLEHDEAASPGADDARFIALRTVDGYPGVYVNNPRIFSAPGSDFQYIQHRRVINLAEQALGIYLTGRLSKPIIVNKTSGFILETEAQEIEAGGRAAMRGVLMAKPKASAVDFTVSRTDNLLSTQTLTGAASIVPLAYPKAINVTIGFRNPALSVLTA